MQRQGVAHQREGSTTFAYLNPRRLSAPSLAPLALLHTDCRRTIGRLGLPQGLTRGFLSLNSRTHTDLPQQR